MLSQTQGYTTATASYLRNVLGPRPALYKSQSPPINDFNFKLEPTALELQQGCPVLEVLVRACLVSVVLSPGDWELS